jgi:2-methylcitrate dehydratase PrpD
MVKRLHAGLASESGVVAAQLARRGFTGTPDVFDLEFGGYYSTLQGEPGGAGRLAAQLPSLGEEWATPSVGFKIHASCAANHTTLDVVRDLRHQHTLDPDDVAAVRVSTSHHTLVHCGWPYVPGDVTNAQMSLRYGVASMLVAGSAFVEQFTEEQIRDPLLVDLADRVSVESDEEIDRLGSRLRHSVVVEIETTTGDVLTGRATYRRGSEHDPVGRDEIVAKFGALTAGLADIDSDAILGAVLELERLPDTGALIDELRGSV